MYAVARNDMMLYVSIVRALRIRIVMSNMRHAGFDATHASPHVRTCMEKFGALVGLHQYSNTWKGGDKSVEHKHMRVSVLSRQTLSLPFPLQHSQQ